MAGDWIKIEHVTLDKPEVMQMATILELEDYDYLIGKMLRFWVWADQQSLDGDNLGVSKEFIDRIARCPGLADALEAVGWLTPSADGLSIPNFTRHNGQSAKARADAAQRQRASRARKTVTETCDKTRLPRPLVRDIYERENYTCAYCGVESSAERENTKKARLSVDHIIPRSMGGATSADNLVCCCRLCNNEKNNRTPEEWGMELEFLQPGVTYLSQKIVTKTQPEKRREEVPVRTYKGTPDRAQELWGMVSDRPFQMGWYQPLANRFGGDVVVMALQKVADRGTHENDLDGRIEGYIAAVCRGGREERETSEQLADRIVEKYGNAG
jgi:5-methylcytosine-specific restriction endonuclease McrA